eukprot:scaffold922_cov31-Tisochrysis_lutea.AAC.1
MGEHRAGGVHARLADRAGTDGVDRVGLGQRHFASGRGERPAGRIGSEADSPPQDGILFDGSELGAYDLLGWVVDDIGVGHDHVG